MDLQTIAFLTGLPVRKIRYVLDHRLLPGLQVTGQPDLVGRARILTELEGFSVACAAILLELGMKKDAVVDFMAGLSRFPLEKRLRGRRTVNAIQKAFELRDTSAEALLADGTYLRFKLGDKDTGWIQSTTCDPPFGGYQPRVVISIDLARLRDTFLVDR